MRLIYKYNTPLKMFWDHLQARPKYKKLYLYMKKQDMEKQGKMKET